MVSTWLFPFALLAVLSANFFLNHELRHLDPAWVDPWIERNHRHDVESSRAFAFGEIPLLIDWLWMNSILDPAISHVRPGSHPTTFYDLELALELDPAFFDAYYFGANSLAVIRNDIPGALLLLNRAEQFRKNELPTYPEEFRTKYWNKEWVLPLTLAYVQLFELENLPEAAKAFIEASRISGAPEYLGNLRKKLETVEGQYEVGARLLRFMLDSSRDPRIREKFESKLRSITVGRYLFLINRDFSEFRKNQPAESAWTRYCLKHPCGPDPLGGRVYLTPQGKVESTTPREKTLSMEY